jgi:hypothetical protein
MLLAEEALHTLGLSGVVQHLMLALVLCMASLPQMSLKRLTNCKMVLHRCYCVQQLRMHASGYDAQQGC